MLQNLAPTATGPLSTWTMNVQASGTISKAPPPPSSPTSSRPAMQTTNAAGKVKAMNILSALLGLPVIAILFL
jgi:hypothetical protein